MVESSDLTNLLLSLLSAIPMVLVDLGGIVYALSYWNRHPRVSLLVVLALVLALANLVVGNAIMAVLPRWLIERGGDGRDMRSVFTVVGFFRSMLSAVSGILLLAAAFGWRDFQSFAWKKTGPGEFEIDG